MTPRDIIAGLLLVIDWIGDGLQEDDPADHEEHVKYLFEEKWVNEFYTWRNEEHNGDCTDVPMTCTRCMIDNYYRLADQLISFQTLPRDWNA